jgi:serine phosphatase RsbU (regulator of sigma subunit)
VTGASELTLGPEADAVPRARRFAASTLRAEPRNIVEDAELVVTELVTNALLHGNAPVTLRLLWAPDRIRVEVEDLGRGMPVLIRQSPDSLTGRGLRLVAALSSGWGVETGSAGGKVVWAELPQGGTSAADAPEPDIDVDALLASWDEPPEIGAEPLYTIRLGAVPTELLLAAKAQIDNLVREYRLSASGAGITPEVAQLAETITESLSWARAEIKRQALEAAALGAAETELVLQLPASAADAGERYLEALDLADSYARVGQLLTLETPRLHRVFRQWYVGALVDQLRAQSEGKPPPPTPTFQRRLVDEVTTLAQLEEAGERLRLLQSVTAELTGARTVSDIAEIVVLNATRALGARSARIYLLSDDGILRSIATRGGFSRLAEKYDELHVDEDLPGGVALRTGTTLYLRSLAEIAERFPALADVYNEERSLHVAPLIVGEHRLGVLSLTFLGRSLVDTHTQTTFLNALAAACAQALERASATARAEAATERLAFLAEASVVLSQTLEYDETLAAVAELVVPRLADWCVIQVLEGGVLRNAALRHFDPAKLAWAESMEGRYPTDMHAATGAPNVIRTGVSELYPVIPEALLVSAAVDDEHLELIRRLGMSSAMVVPLTGRRGTFGAISMIQAESGRVYDETDVAFAQDLARRAALAVETAHAFLRQSGRLAEVRRIAEAAQHAILAAPPKKIGPVALSARYVSAAAEALIGGDLYEVVTRPGVVRLLIGDVRGKGLAAVRTATIVLGEFRAAAADVADLVDVATQIDRRLRPYLGDEDFVTALLAEIADDGTFAIASCGHPPALLAGSGRVTAIESAPTLPLGLGAAPTLVSGRLQDGDRLLLYTDGIIEARDRNREFVDLMALVRPLLAGALDVVLDDILAALRNRVGTELDDDMALLVAEYQGP